MKDTIKKIIRLPYVLRKETGKSIYSLLEETKYFDSHNKVSVEDMKTCLSENLEYIQYWLEYSADKRTSSGWYISKVRPDRFVVGLLNSNNIHEETEYSDELSACANFIKKEIEELRTEIP